MTVVTEDRRVFLDWDDVYEMSAELAGRWRGDTQVHDVFGVPRGGIVPALLVSQALGLPMVTEPHRFTLVVDDLIDMGGTRDRYPERHFDTLLRKSHSPDTIRPPFGQPRTMDGWMVFPWERHTEDDIGPTDAVARLLAFIDPDPGRDGLRDTPARVVRAMVEMTGGYHLDPAKILSRTFDQTYDEMVIVRRVDFTSMCEHHLLTFTGEATVAYIPGEGDRGVVGLSKLARLVDCFAMRLQLQERMTLQIADALEAALEPRGVGVLVKAHHSCMGCRGVRKPRAEMVTSRLTGIIKDDAAARAEFMALANG